MQIDFHYYLIYVLAERAGFNRDSGSGETEAGIIAYASQYVDDNNDSQVIGVDGEEPSPIEEFADVDIFEEIKRYQRFPWAVRVKETGNFFRPIMTQTASLKSLIPMFQKCVFVPFHFLPGDRERIPVIKGRINPYSTTPNSRNAQSILKAALDSGDLYRIGVALHTFADTWSHQHFSGLREDWNATRGNILIPDIGHAEALRKPDIISETWVDPRLPKEEQKINNAERALEAVEEVFCWLSKYRRSDLQWEDVKEEFEELIEARDAEERVNMVKRMFPNENIDYDKTKWISQALSYDPDKNEVVAKENFRNSHWYRFQLAAKKQLTLVFSLLEKIEV